MMTGLYTFSSKLPCDPAKPTAAVAPCTCTQTMVIASACVGFTLPGMIEDPGSFSGMESSPSPQRGPLRELGMRIQPCADSGSTNCQIVESLQRLLQALDVALQQRSPAAELLPKG